MSLHTDHYILLYPLISLHIFIYPLMLMKYLITSIRILPFPCQATPSPLRPRLCIWAAGMVVYRTAKFLAHPSILAAVAGGRYPALAPQSTVPAPLLARGPAVAAPGGGDRKIQLLTPVMYKRRLVKLHAAISRNSRKPDRISRRINV
jgi:hypothetical protein